MSFDAESWTLSPRWFTFGTDGGTQGELPLGSNSAAVGTLEAYDVTVRSFDGTEIPLSIVHEQGLPRDGSAPTWLIAYGAYGHSIEPYFAPAWRAWLKRGGVFAVAHVRGGGEYGEAWHRAGMKATKLNSVRDYLAAAHYLVDQRYTRSSRLGAMVASAGAIVAGMAVVMDPAVFSVASIDVGLCNPLRVHAETSGPGNVPEFGDIGDEQEFRALLAMDPYQNVRSDIDYPAVLLTASINDARVPPWQPSKLAASLQAASSSHKPILLKVNRNEGHGLSSTRTQRARNIADQYAFALWQFGDPEFQPR